MKPGRTLALGLLAAAGCTVPAAGQSTGGQLRPEIGIYVQQGEMVRIEFVDSSTGNLSTHNWQGNFQVYVRTALKPVIRRELRDRPDAYRNKYLSFRAGYRYRTGLTPSDAVSENRGILELTSRYLLPWHLVVSDRNRGEFRFIKGQPFSTRYANRLQLERDISYHSFSFTPYVYDEIFTIRAMTSGRRTGMLWHSVSGGPHTYWSPHAPGRQWSNHRTSTRPGSNSPLFLKDKESAGVALES